MTTLYKTYDGLIFENLWDAEKHEFPRLHSHIHEVKFYDLEGNLMSTEDIDIDHCDQYYLNCSRIEVPTEEALEDLHVFSYVCGWYYISHDIDKPGIWRYIEETFKCNDWKSGRFILEKEL